MSVTTRTERLINALLALLAFSLLYACAKPSVTATQASLFPWYHFEIQDL